QRSFIFRLLIKVMSRMPLCIVMLGAIFNLVNAYLIGGWLFYVAPEGEYTPAWLADPRFVGGVVLFFAGMAVNLHSDHIIRHLRKPGDRRHYIPRGGMFRYVTSANYLGELMEWIGFAVLTWSLPGVIFALWTFANLGPRARSLHQRYIDEFGDEFRALNRKYIIPFIW
ncbi:MAG: 3-oxo-5-alpha-steroid 4-dehydrogenase, partial [Muribaculaceae bacterium]|nr:3-oxo-5-alpha-steroid 4-dehydrogenase [Muribaculaceae bacterium]